MSANLSLDKSQTMYQCIMCGATTKDKTEERPCPNKAGLKDHHESATCIWDDRPLPRNPDGSRDLSVYCECVNFEQLSGLDENGDHVVADYPPDPNCLKCHGTGRKAISA